MVKRKLFFSGVSSDLEQNWTFLLSNIINYARHTVSILYRIDQLSVECTRSFAAIPNSASLTPLNSRRNIKWKATYDVAFYTSDWFIQRWSRNIKALLNKLTI